MLETRLRSRYARLSGSSTAQVIACVSREKFVQHYGVGGRFGLGKIRGDKAGASTTPTGRALTFVVAGSAVLGLNGDGAAGGAGMSFPSVAGFAE